MVMSVMKSNVGLARELIRRIAPKLRNRATPCPNGCDRALEHAILTPPGAMDEAARARLQAVAGRVL
jgi:5'-methylthioadenosine phosphorylase